MFETIERTADRSTADFLDELDAKARDTSGPDEEDDEEKSDTGDPEDDEREETGAPVATVRADVMAHLEALMKRNGGRAPTREDLVGMVLHHRKKARRPLVRSKTAIRHLPSPPIVPAHPLHHPPVPRRVIDLRNDVFSEYRRALGRPVVQTKGFYFGMAEVIFTGEGDKSIAALTLAPSTSTVFHEAIDVGTTRLGTTHKATPADTNLQNPGENLFPNEKMIITHLSMELAGYRVQYDPSDVGGLKLPQNVLEALSGRQTLFDEDGILLPKEIYDRYTGRSLLAEALNPSGVLYFAWKKRVSGGSNDTKEIFINHLQAIPKQRKDLHETSGGAALLAMNEGYIWSLNQQQPGQGGLFEARLKTHDNLILPINAVPIPAGGTAFVPKQLGVYFRVTLYGDMIRPADDVLKPGKAER